MRSRNIFLEKRIYLSLKKSGQLSSDEYYYLQAFIMRVLRRKLANHLPGFAFQEDLVHSALEILIMKIRANAFQFDEAKGLLAYISITLRNLVIQEQRLAGRVNVSPESENWFVQSDIYSHLSSEEILGLMREVLSEKAYKMMQMYLEGYDNHEIAKELGYKNAATVANKKYQYREKLKAAMGSMAA